VALSKVRTEDTVVEWPVNFTVIWHFVRSACELIDVFVPGVGAGEAATYVLTIL